MQLSCYKLYCKFQATQRACSNREGIWTRGFCHVASPLLIDVGDMSHDMCGCVQVVVGSQERVPAAIKHRYIVCEPSRRLAVLASSLRADLANADPDEAPARVMLFTNTPEEAAAVADPLRTALWTEHRLAVLLPIKGE